MAEWISVKDRLPENRNRILIYNKEGEIGTGYFSSDYFWPDGDYMSSNVTHWTLLPDPPEVTQ